MTGLQSEDLFAGARTASLECQSAQVDRFRFDGGVMLPSHDHADPLLVVQTRGGYRGSIEGHDYELRAGSALALPATSRHAEHIGPLTSEALLIRMTGAAPLRPGKHPRPARGRQVKAIAKHLTQEIDQPDMASGWIVEGLVLRLQELLGDATESGPGRSGAWLEDAVDILETAELDQAPSLGELAASLEVHPSHLARSLKRRLGMSAGAYIRRRRLTRAAALLAESELPISWIALECGFYDQSHFSNLFRRAYGVPPSVFRAKQQGAASQERP